MNKGLNGHVGSTAPVVDRDRGTSVSGEDFPLNFETRRRLSPAERHKLLFDWNRTRTDYPRDRCLHHLIEAQTERTPDSTAVESEGQSLTYRQLNLRANRLAHQLRSLGVGAETLVGICLEPSTDLLIALLAVMKAGGAYVPLDASYPAERIAFMVGDSAMTLVVTRESLRALLPAEQTRILVLDELPLDCDESGNLDSEVTPENLAYVIYTSGSTGRPKGVMVTHRGLVNYLVWAVKAYRVGEGSGAPVHTSISFDLTITGLFAPLLVGRTVRMLPQNLENLSVALRNDSPFSLVKITPAHLELLCAQWEKHDCAAGTNFFIVGGEALFGQSLELSQRCAPEATLVNEYGPTETVVGCCVYFVPKNHAFDGTVPIGRPIANTQLYVLDEFLQPVALGAVGELHIAGDGLARGYLNQPELTAEKFIMNPFAFEDENTSPRMYKSGDLVRYRTDGNLEFLGRADDQIKMRGYRIEPAEIEAALLTHPAVRNAAVISLTSAEGDKFLAAYLIESDETTNAFQLREHLKTRLPDYMMPAAFVVLPELPLTANGKVNRKALPPPEHKEAEADGSQNSLQIRVAELWSEALQRPVGLDENFFELGGYSLLAVRLVARMNELFHTRLDALSFYQHPTVRDVVRLLEQSGEARSAQLICVRPGRGESPVIFLNPPLEFVRLASWMPEDRPFFISEVAFPEGTIEAALRFETSAFPSLREMVTPHVELILSSDLRHPIFLAGYSSYGTVAFEVAHQLRAAGKEVAGVFLFDADMKAPRWAELRVRARRHARNAMRDGAPYLWKKIRARVARRNATNGAVAPQIEVAAPEAALSNGEISWRIFQRIWDHALRDYRPRPLDAPGILFRAQITIYGDIHDHDGCLGWRGLFRKGLTTIEIPGDHVSMWKEPDVHALVEAWQHSLGKPTCTAA